jgi:hypothetical protein
MSARAALPRPLKPDLPHPLKAIGKLAENPPINGQQFNPTDDQRDLERVLAAQPNSQKLIALVIGCDVKTLRKAFRAELHHGRELVDAMVGAAVVRSALQGNVAAQKFYLLTHRVPGWQIPHSGDPSADAAIAAALAANGDDADLKPRIYIPETDREEDQ